MNRAWILGAGVAALVAGVYALNAQVVPQPGPPVAIACAFNTVPPTLTTGQAGWVQCDNAGKLITSGGGGGGGDVNVTEWASTALGAPSTFGTSPGAVTVPGVNAYVTNAVALGQAAMAASTPVVIASNQSSIPVAATLNAETTKVIGTVNLSTGQSIALTTGTADIGNVGGSVNVTPTNCGGTITSGGTAQNAITAQSTLSGLMIANIDTTEPMWISFTSTAAASDTQSYPLPAGAATTFAGFGSYSSQFGFGVNTALSVIAATTGHKFTCTRW